jgi:hypothetical protein
LGPSPRETAAEAARVEAVPEVPAVVAVQVETEEVKDRLHNVPL